jgi:hypothetical protein
MKMKIEEKESANKIINDVQLELFSSSNTKEEGKNNNERRWHLVTERQGQPLLSIHAACDSNEERGRNGKLQRPIGYGKVSCVIDTSAEEALAWLWDYCSLSRMTTAHSDDACKFFGESSLSRERSPFF